MKHEKSLKEEKDTFEKRARDMQIRMDDNRREHDSEMTAIKTDLRLAKEDTLRFQQDLEDAEAKLKDGEFLF